MPTVHATYLECVLSASRSSRERSATTLPGPRYVPDDIFEGQDEKG
jgi:hypothetical protein